MRSSSFAILILFGLFLSGCSLDESQPVSKSKTPDALSLDKLKSAEEAPAPAPAAPQSSAQTSPTPMPKQYSFAPTMQIDVNKSYTATLHTEKGDIVIALTAKETPITVNNFVFLAKDHFYDHTVFHRTIPGFMIQGGDPLGTGMGGPGYEFNDEPFTGEYARGTVAMANSGPNTNGSQFFIMHADYALPKNYVIFGHVTEGMDAVDAIATAPTKPGGEGSSPVAPVVISSVDIAEK